MTADGEHQLTPEQREAIDSRDRDVFLRAGAGTGKTTVLVDRFCAAALDPDVGVDRILAFTFTERAADQLRRRVRERFAQLGREAEGERWERIERVYNANDPDAADNYLDPGFVNHNPYPGHKRDREGFASDDPRAEAKRLLCSHALIDKEAVPL